MFRVSCVGATYLLRVGPARTIHEPAAALAEQAWTASLADRGLHVPRVIPALDGSASVQVVARDVPGKRECMLLTWQTGQPLRRPVARQDVADLAVLCAQFHEASAVGNDRPAGVLDGRRVVQFKVPDLIDEAPGTIRDIFREAAARAQHGLDKLWATESGAPRLIHSDLTPNNVLRNRGRLAAIDFQDLTWGHLQQDLANTLFGITRGIDIGDCLPAFRSSYAQIRPWPELDDELLADLCAARRIAMLNLALFMSRPGLGEYLEGHGAALRAYVR